MLKRFESGFAVRLLLAAGLMMQVIWWGMLWSRRIFQPAQSLPTDYSIFYTAGRIANTGDYHQLYDIQTQLAVQEKLKNMDLLPPDLLPFNHPPFLVPLLELVTDGNYMASYWRWAAIMLVFLAASLLLLGQLARNAKWGAGETALLFISVLTFYPIIASLLKGQDSIFLVFGAMLWLWGMVKGRDTLAGLGLALTVIRPQIALVLALPFLFRRRRVFWAFLAGAAFLSLFSLALVGVQGVRDFIAMIGISTRGEGFGMYQHAMFNFLGMVIRLFPQGNVNAIHIAAWALFGVVIAALSAWFGASKSIETRHLITASTLSVFAAPHLHYHDLSMLVIPLVALAFLVFKDGSVAMRKFAPMLPLMASVLFLIGDAFNSLRYILPYLIMVAAVLLAFQVSREKSLIPIPLERGAG